MPRSKTTVAEPTTGPVRSYIARYRAVKDGDWLIGGIKESQSCRYDSRSDAQDRLEQVIAINGGEAFCQGEVVESRRQPEIFRHCGRHTTSLGSICPGCRTLMTIEHARTVPLRA